MSAYAGAKPTYESRLSDWILCRVLSLRDPDSTAFPPEVPLAAPPAAVVAAYRRLVVGRHRQAHYVCVIAVPQAVVIIHPL